MAIFQQIGVPELLVIGVIALLIFGKRLPEVGRSLGKSFVEFKKGLQDTGEEIKQIKSDTNRTLSDDQASERSRQFNEPQKTTSESKITH